MTPGSRTPSRPVPRRGPARVGRGPGARLSPPRSPPAAASPAATTTKDMLMMIPNSPGGGYDQTGRAAVSVMEREDITGGTFEVTNVIGAGGSVAMTRLMNAEGDEHTMMTVGLGVVGLDLLVRRRVPAPGRHPAGPADERPEGVLVPADSPYKTIDDFVEGLEGGPGRPRRSAAARRPAARTTSSRCSWPSAVGVDPKRRQLRVLRRRRPLTSALLGNKIDVGFSGLGGVRGPDRGRRAAGAGRLRRGALTRRAGRRRRRP